ncbi:hypothetical protein IU449_11220 [Nocardia higoensis]|uniref:Prevent-host-death protein n=1 Tax=Nocardia higoensis TaxID=228599 RepID=A0ABS0D9E9_9NOCA|nr:hypothetical protein [Nocardia higoensis]MBF6355103.1 hypothetical protein [Nocardia higoensis]
MSKRERVSEQSLLDHARAVSRRVAAGAACEITVGGRSLGALPSRRRPRPVVGPSRYAVSHADPACERLDRVLAEAARLDPLPLDPLSVDPAQLRRAVLDSVDRPHRS